MMGGHGEMGLENVEDILALCSNPLPMVVVVQYLVEGDGYL